MGTLGAGAGRAGAVAAISRGEPAGREAAWRRWWKPPGRRTRRMRRTDRLPQKSSRPSCGPYAPVRSLTGPCLRSSCLVLLPHDLPGCRPLPKATRSALVVGHPLTPLAGATLGAGPERGMVHGDQGRGRDGRVVWGHWCKNPPHGTSETSRWRLPHTTSAGRPGWSRVAGGAYAPG
jgi:hypothetical protein